MSSPFPIFPDKFIHKKTKNILRIFLFIFLGLSVSCSFPGFSPDLFPGSQLAATVTTSAPTAAPESLPPVLLETDPPQGSLLPLNEPITLTFNQPMQRESVEAALSGDAALIGDISWNDDSTLVLTPKAALNPDSDINITIGIEAKAASGQALREPISLNYHTVGYLKLAQSLPEPDAEEVDPSSAIVASFNQPVIALGVDTNELAAAFSISSSSDPKVEGKGEWLNTSTYIFYPEPALLGGKRYTVSLNPKIESNAGSVLESSDGWSFSTAAPRLVSTSPEKGVTQARLDTPVVMVFSQAMDAASVQAGFQLLDARQKPVEGSFAWDNTGKVMTYTLATILERDKDYKVTLSGDVLAQGGTALGNGFESLFHTLPRLKVMNVHSMGRSGLWVTLSAPIQQDLQEKMENYVSITPALENYEVEAGFDPYQEGEYYIYIRGDLQYDTSYTLRISPDLPDAWGSKLGNTYSLAFRTRSASPNLGINISSEAFLTPQDNSIPATVTNLESINLTRSNVTLADFFRMMSETGYEFRQTYKGADEKSWSQSFITPHNVSQQVNLNLSSDKQPLSPGLYYLKTQSDVLTPSTDDFLLMVSNIHLTFKISPTDALIWAVDLRNNTPVAGTTITLYDGTGNQIANGQTDANGVFFSAIPEQASLYDTFFAVAGNPGEDGFGIALSNWDTGIDTGEFDILSRYALPHLISYIYTDRPIYRPGQTVDYRIILRQAFNGRYAIPDLSASQGLIPVTIYGELGQELNKINLPVSAFGSANAQFTLPSDAVPGYYRIACDLTEESDVVFQVANYRKPEINLQVDFSKAQALSGETLSVNISARYFFDAPAGNTSLHWVLYSTGEPFYITGYHTGLEGSDWLESYSNEYYSYDQFISEGDAQTQADGSFSLELPTELSNYPQQLTLEATITDESGFPVSARGSMILHPATFYIGIHPQSWNGKAGDQFGFDIQTVDWAKAPSGPHELKAVFQKVTWVKNKDAEESEIFFDMSYTEQYTVTGSADFAVDNQGMARLAFTPPDPGVYKLDVSGENAITSLYLWVGGSAQAVWPNLPNQRMRLTPDKESYKAGEIAKIFIPNPFGTVASALISFERSIILRHQVVTIEPGGSTLDVPLSNEDAPNIYVSATLIGINSQGKADFRQGYLNLSILPEEQQLNVSITSNPQKAGPGDEISYDIQVKDKTGNPVQGEFSLAVVDQAVLSLADPNSKDILTAFYGNQPISIRTGVGLTAYAFRKYIYPGDFGGGGGEPEPGPVTRENFPDTAYWAANIVTGADGSAQVNMTLPDNLTTWQVDLRGLTADTRVGEAQTQIVSTKDLLLRPAIQRFFVRGDHVRLATVVQNNTPSQLSADVTIQAEGIVLDDPDKVTQRVNIPAGGGVPVEWWGTVQGVNSVSLTFSTQAGEYQDAILVQNGAIPVLAYLAPQTYSTSGALEQAADLQELVNLPRNITNTTESGGLELELSTSLAGMIGEALDVLEYYPYECTEQTVSRFLPNLESYLTFQQLNMAAPELKSRLERTLNEGLSLLSSQQNEDGGWAWWQGGESDPFITSYVLVGLTRARNAGFAINEKKIQKGVEYLMAGLTTPSMLGKPYLLDRLAFEHYALALAGEGNQAGVQELFAVRDNLDPWAKAYLLLAMKTLSANNPQTKTLISDLESTAIRTATGAHWEATHAGRHNMQSTIATTAIILYTLAQEQPKSPLVSEATRYLSFQRRTNGAWDSTFSSAWSIMALSEVMRRTGELRGDFTYSALLNGTPIASGKTSQDNLFTPISTDISLDHLYSGSPNTLTIRRSEGLGILYYRADLQVFRPVEDATQINQGVNIERQYHAAGSTCRALDCPTIHETTAGDKVIARLTLTLANDAYYLVVEDFIPAGVEILDTSLKTSQMGITGEELFYDPQNPFEYGWGWWYFSDPQIYDDHIAWAVDYLPAGSYELTYTLVTLLPGEYRVLPAHAWEFYFPEVQGTSAGEVFTIK